MQHLWHSLQGQKHFAARLIIIGFMTQDKHFLTAAKSPTYAGKTRISYPSLGFVLKLSPS